jgi:hypothetical protein
VLGRRALHTTIYCERCGGANPRTAEEKVKYKSHTEVLHEIDQRIQGNEPFLSFVRPRMIVNLSGGYSGSHNFFEGNIDSFSRVGRGDTLVFQLQHVSQVPMTWWERVWSWVRGLK